MEGGNRRALKQIPCCLVTRGAEGSCKIWLNSEGAIKMAMSGFRRYAGAQTFAGTHLIQINEKHRLPEVEATGNRRK